MKKIAIVLCATVLLFADIEAGDDLHFKESSSIDTKIPVPATLYVVCKLKTKEILDSIVVSQEGNFIYHNGFSVSNAVISGKVVSFPDECSISKQLLQIFGYEAEIVSFEIPSIIPEKLVTDPANIWSTVKKIYGYSLCYKSLEKRKAFLF